MLLLSFLQGMMSMDLFYQEIHPPLALLLTIKTSKSLRYLKDKGYIDKSIQENEMQEAIVSLESTRPTKSRLKSQAVTVTRKVSSYFSDPSASMTQASSSSSQLSPSSSAALVRLMTLILTDSKLAANLQVAFYYIVVPMYHKL